VGDPVLYRGEGHLSQDIIWRIKKVGDKFITIETSDPRIQEIEDFIQVVSPNEIYRPDTQTHLQNMGYVEPVIYNEPYSQPFLPGANDSHIHFAPKIIVNGSDYSNDSEQHHSPEMLVSEPSTSGSPFIIKEPPTAITENSSNEIDFRQPLLIIKK
jgi:hypothetical protein